MPDENLPAKNTDDSNNQNTPEIAPHTSGDIIHPSTADSTTETANTSSSLTPEDAAPLEQPAQEQRSVLEIPESTVVQKKSRKKLAAIFGLVLIILAGAGAWMIMKGALQTETATQNSRQTADIPSLSIGSTEGPASTYFPNEDLLGIFTVLNRQIYEGLVGYENNKITPLLAESWTNPDQNTWVFKLRSGSVFHTGKPVNATEVKASLDSLKQYDYWSLYVSTISSIEATGEYEITIKTEEPDALLLNRLTQAYITDISAPDKGGANGTGAYIVDASANNTESITTLVPFDNYYGAPAKVRKLIFRIYETEDELPIALKNKEIDLIETLTYPELNKEMIDLGYASAEYETPGVFGLYMNLTRNKTTPLLDKDVRLAIAQAMDRQSLVDTLGNKNTPSTQVIPKSLPGHDPSIKAPAFDVAAAQATLSKTKFAKTPLEFVYIKELQEDAPIIIEQLRAAGFIIKEKVYSSTDIDSAVGELNGGKYDLFAASYVSDFADARDLLGSLLHSTESSYGNYNDPVYDEMLTASDKEFDPVKRIQLLQKANNYIMDNLVWVPLRNGVYNSYYAKDLDITIDYTGGAGLGVYYRKVGRIVQ